VAERTRLLTARGDPIEGSNPSLYAEQSGGEEMDQVIIEDGRVRRLSAGEIAQLKREQELEWQRQVQQGRCV
jgi:hypothetical protein